MAHTSMVHIRVDQEIKSQASEALAAMGLSLSDAVPHLPQADSERSGVSFGTQGTQRRDPSGYRRVARHDESPARPI